MAAPAALNRDVVFIESQGVAANGRPVPFKTKVIRFSNGTIRRAVWDILDAFFPEKVYWETSRVMSSSMGAVEERLRIIGRSFWPEVTPNFKAYLADPEFYNGETVDTQHMREDFHVTTEGLITWLLTWSACRHSNIDKSKAKAILEGILMCVLDSTEFVCIELFELFDHVFSKCIMRTSQLKPCGHVPYIMRSLPKNKNKLWSWRTFVDMLMDFLFDNECNAAKSMYIALLDHMEELIGKHIRGEDAADILKESVPFYTPTGKRRRICEDYRDTLVQTKVDSYIRPTQLSVFTDMVHPNTTLSWARVLEMRTD